MDFSLNLLNKKTHSNTKQGIFHWNRKHTTYNWSQVNSIEGIGIANLYMEGIRKEILKKNNKKRIHSKKF